MAERSPGSPCGPSAAPGDGADDASGGEGGGGAGVNATFSAFLHGEDFFGLARPSGAFGVTSARHKERRTGSAVLAEASRGPEEGEPLRGSDWRRPV